MTVSGYSPRIPHRVFEKLAASVPERVAAVSENEVLTYGDLNARANQLAHYLREQQGVRSGDAVGVCTDHDPVRLVALLAVVKCGAAYVPVDASCPSDRLQHMVQRAKIRVLLSALDRRPVNGVNGFPEIDIYEALNTPGLSVDNVQIDADTRDPLYIIFTSGSTGLPKGVSVSHAAAWNHFQWIIGYLKFSEDDRWLQSINPCFDPSMHELLAPITIGATVCFLGGSRRIESAEIVDAIRWHSATHITTVPTMFNLICQTPGFEQCTTLKAICVGGEVFRPALAKRAQQLLPNAAIHNVYGPTEATIMASAWRYDGAPRDSLPIGDPVSETRFYLRSTLEGGWQTMIKPTAPGEQGELCITGAALANEYVNDAAETAKKFIENPLFKSCDPDIFRRIYLTGDICRVDSGGLLHYVGRIDDQLKINGQRVELADIEFGLMNANVVVDVAALIIEERLVAAVVLAPGATEIWRQELKNCASRRLPAAWIPKTFVVVAQIPRQSVSGKVDRRALATLCSKSLDSDKSASASPTDIESEVCRILCEVVGIKDHRSVDRDQPFAELGLDSLGVQAMSLKLGGNFGVRLRPEDIFEFHTVDLLSGELRSRIALASPLREHSAPRE